MAGRADVRDQTASWHAVHAYAQSTSSPTRRARLIVELAEKRRVREIPRRQPFAKSVSIWLVATGPGHSIGSRTRPWRSDLSAAIIPSFWFAKVTN